MDIKTSATIATPTIASINTPDTDTELIPTSDPKSGFRAFAYTNGGGGGGLLKPHHSPRVVIPLPLPLPPQSAVEYKECLKNHAVAIGGHALDGCGEFYPSPTSDPANPTSLKCAACDCHRNFHRRDYPDERAMFTPPKSASAILVSASHHHLHHRLLPPPPAQHSSSPSPNPSRSTSPGPSTTSSPHSPPPVSHLPPSFFGTPSHMLLALSSSVYTVPPPYGRDENSKQQLYRGPTTKSSFDPMSTAGNNNNKTTERKRSRTKFSQEQKDKMFSFADKLGWKMQRSEDKFVADFCDQLGIGRHVFKVWMHNNKQQRRKKRMMSSAPPGLAVQTNDGGGGGGASFDSIADEDEEMHMEAMDNENDNNVNVNVNVNVDVDVDVVMSNNPHNDEEGSKDQRFYFSNRGSSCSS